MITTIRTFLIIVLVATATATQAANLSGRISQQGFGNSTARVEVDCGGQRAAVAVDRQGGYQLLRLPNNRTCQVQVRVGNQLSQPVSVSLGSGTKTFNALVRNYKGKAVLIQR